MAYSIVTARTIINQTATIPGGLQSIAAMNVGDTNATLTFVDGSSILLRPGGTFSIGLNTDGYSQMIIAALTTTVDIVVSGISGATILIV